MKSNHSKSKGTITLNCFVDYDRLNDCRTVVAGWRMYESLEESSTKSLGGAVNLQTIKALVFVLSNGRQSWMAILSRVSSNIDQFINDPDFPLLLFDLEFTVGDQDVYDEYGKEYLVDYNYTNLRYSRYMDSDTLINTLGQDLGVVMIEEEDPVTHVDLYGYGVKLPSYVEVNSIRKYWHYQESDEQIEKLTWDLPANTKQIMIASPIYQNPINTLYFGSVIRAVCTFPDSSIDILNTAFEGV